MKDIYSLLDGVRSELQLDVYALYREDETKHALGEEIFAAIIAGIVVEYLKGLFRPEEMGKEHLGKFKEWFAKLKQGQQNPFTAEAAAKAALDRALKKKFDEDDHQRAQSLLALELQAAGVPKDTAENVATKVSRQMQAHLNSPTVKN